MSHKWSDIKAATLSAEDQKDIRIKALEDMVENIEKERDRFKAALERIAEGANGWHQHIARAALSGTGAPCRYCGQSEANHRDGISAARDCRYEARR